MLFCFAFLICVEFLTNDLQHTHFSSVKLTLCSTEHTHQVIFLQFLQFLLIFLDEKQLETIGKLDAIVTVLGCMFDPAPCQEKSKEQKDIKSEIQE